MGLKTFSSKEKSAVCGSKPRGKEDVTVRVEEEKQKGVQLSLQNVLKKVCCVFYAKVMSLALVN